MSRPFRAKTIAAEHPGRCPGLVYRTPAGLAVAAIADTQQDLVYGQGTQNLGACGRRDCRYALPCEPALITNPPKASRSMWVRAHKAIFSKGAATPGLNGVGGVLIEPRELDASGPGD